MALSSNIRYHRLKNKMSQSALAKELGIDQSCVTRWENGERQPKLNDLCRIAEKLKTSTADLIDSSPLLAPHRMNPLDNDPALSKMPFYVSRVAAGFPSPADDYVEKSLNLHELLVKNNSATFFVKVEGDSMLDARIHDGDILIVDRSMDPSDGKIVIAVLDGELTVKRVRKGKNKLLLVSENPEYKPIEISEDSDFIVWGVVTNVIHPV